MPIVVHLVVDKIDYRGFFEDQKQLLPERTAKIAITKNKSAVLCIAMPNTNESRLNRFPDNRIISVGGASGRVRPRFHKETRQKLNVARRIAIEFRV